jgi:hypothetical protein
MARRYRRRSSSLLSTLTHRPLPSGDDKTPVKGNHNFDTLQSLLSFVNKPKAWREHVMSHTFEHTGGNWYGTNDYDSAINLALHGWPEGRSYLTSAVNAVATAKSHNLAHAFSYDVAGHFPHVARAVAGDPLNMISFEPIEIASKPIVRLAFQNNAASSYTGQELLNYGAAIVSICDALENAGYRTEVSCFTYTVATWATPKYAAFASVVVKHAQEHFDIDRMAFTLANPSMLRRVWFSYYEQFADMEEGLSSNYGRPTAPPKSLFDPDQVILEGIGRYTSEQLSTPVKAFEAVLPKVLSLLNLDPNVME